MALCLANKEQSLGPSSPGGGGGRPERLLTGPEAEPPAGLAGAGCTLKPRGGPQSPPRVNCGLLGFAGQELVRRNESERSAQPPPAQKWGCWGEFGLRGPWAPLGLGCEGGRCVWEQRALVGAVRRGKEVN